MDRLLRRAGERAKELEVIGIAVTKSLEESKELNRRLQDNAQTTEEACRRVEGLVRDVFRAVMAVAARPAAPPEPMVSPSPPTRSPVMFANLLPTVKEEGLAVSKLQWMVDEMTMPKVLSGAETDDDGRCHPTGMTRHLAWSRRGVTGR